jgi:perosamine synthetase
MSFLYRDSYIPQAFFFLLDMIAINKPWMGPEEKDEVLRVLDEASLTSAARDGGKRVKDFESLMKNYLRQTKHVLAVNSGTSALHAALLALDVKQGGEVLLPSFTFVATANAVVAAGAKPVFVDVKRNDFTIDAYDLKAKITQRTKAIIPVHLYGHPCDMDEISEIASKNSIPIIEDACQSLGSIYKGKQTGTLGTMGCFSLYASKVLTSGEGGAITTNDDTLADKLKMIRNHGMVEGYDTRIPGLNMRLPEISAAIAKAQMKKLNKMLELRRRNASIMTELLASSVAERRNGEKKQEQGDDGNGIVSIPVESDQKRYNWYLYTIVLAKDRDLIRDSLNSHQIGATVYYDPPVHKTPYYDSNLSSDLPDTDWCAKHVLSLPVHPLVSEQEIQNIADNLKSAIRK